MMKKTFLHGIIAGILAVAACIIYLHIYQGALGADFHKIVNIGTVAGGSILACMIIALPYWGLEKIHKQNLKGWLNVIISLISFAGIIIPISISLPLDIQNPELFPGLVIPMLFFPALAYFAIAPFFERA